MLQLAHAYLNQLADLRSAGRLLAHPNKRLDEHRSTFTQGRRSYHGEIGDVVARRWSDLLILEGIALEVVASHGIPAAHTNLIEASG
jgi:hypothetical protein